MSGSDLACTPPQYMQTLHPARSSPSKQCQTCVVAVAASVCCSTTLRAHKCTKACTCAAWHMRVCCASPGETAKRHTRHLTRYHIWHQSAMQMIWCHSMSASTMELIGLSQMSIGTPNRKASALLGPQYCLWGDGGALLRSRWKERRCTLASHVPSR